MSQEDRDRWDARYAAGAYSSRTHPSAMLKEWISQQGLSEQQLGQTKTPPNALDVACGAGRNSLFLAAQGYSVLGLDISATAIDQARVKANALPVADARPRPEFREQDLDLGLGNSGHKYNITDDEAQNGYQLICLFRYLDLGLVGELLQCLSPGGVLLVEVNLQIPDDHRNGAATLAGPPATTKVSRFRAAPGALLAAVRAGEAAQPERRYRVERAEEGWFIDPDGSHASLARVIVQRTE